MLMEFVRSACDKETEGRFGDRHASMGWSVCRLSEAYYFFFLVCVCECVQNPPHLLLVLHLLSVEEETLNT